MDIKHDVANKKFAVQVAGGEAHAFYRRGPMNSYDIYSVVVPVESRGKNIADQLVREAIKAARAENVKIIPTCPYVVKWFERHPEEQVLLLK